MSVPSREADPSLNFDEFVNNIANHEAKLLTAALLLSDTEKLHTSSTLSAELVARQEPPVGWLIGSGVVVGYCRDSLVPSKVVSPLAITGRNGKPATSYRVTQGLLEPTLARSGFLLGWSLDHPELSVQQALGGSGGNNAQGPATRLGVYDKVLSLPKSPSIVELKESVGDMGYSHPREAFSIIMRMMCDAGTITMDSKKQEHNPMIVIEDPEFPRKRIELTSAETQAVYAAMKAVFLEGGHCDLDTLVERAAAIVPEASKVKIRNKLVSALGDGSKALPGIRRGDTTKHPDSSQTYISLDEDIAPAIRDLSHGLELVKDGQDLQSHTERLHDILHTPTDFTTLMAKARESSPHAAHRDKGRHMLLETITKIVEASDKPLTSKDVAGILRDEHSRLLTIQYTGELLQLLVKSGHAEKHTVTPNDGKRRKFNAYSVLAGQDQQD